MKPNIQSLLDKSVVAGDRSTPPPADELPDLGDEYSAYGRPSNKPMIALHFVLGDQSIVSVQYHELSSWSSFVPSGGSDGRNLLIFRIAAPPVRDVHIEGRNLRRLYDYIVQHRALMVCELPPERDFEDDATPVVNGVTFHEPDGRP